MKAHDNTIQDNAVQDRKNYRTSKHYISIGEGLRKSFIKQDKTGHYRTEQSTTKHYKTKQYSTSQIFTNAYAEYITEQKSIQYEKLIYSKTKHDSINTDKGLNESLNKEQNNTRQFTK